MSQPGTRRTFLSAVTLAGCLAAALLPTPATAAAANRGEACWVDGMAFSVGAVARVGSMPEICAPDHTWQQTSQQTAGCIYESKVYATGALKALGDTGDTKLECLADGTWSPVPKPKAKSR